MSGALIGEEAAPCSRHSSAPIWCRVGVVESAYFEGVGHYCGPCRPVAPTGPSRPSGAPQRRAGRRAKARPVPPHRASAQPAASSASRFLPRATSAAWLQKLPYHRTWPSKCRSSPRRPVFASQVSCRCSSLVLLQHCDNLLFRESCSLNLSVLAQAGLSPSKGNTPEQVKTFSVVANQNGWARRHYGKTRDQRG